MSESSKRRSINAINSVVFPLVTRYAIITPETKGVYDEIAYMRKVGIPVVSIFEAQKLLLSENPKVKMFSDVVEKDLSWWLRQRVYSINAQFVFTPYTGVMVKELAKMGFILVGIKNSSEDPFLGKEWTTSKWNSFLEDENVYLNVIREDFKGIYGIESRTSHAAFRKAGSEFDFGSKVEPLTAMMSGMNNHILVNETGEFVYSCNNGVDLGVIKPKKLDSLVSHEDELGENPEDREEFTKLILKYVSPIGEPFSIVQSSDYFTWEKLYQDIDISKPVLVIVDDKLRPDLTSESQGQVFFHPDYTHYYAVGWNTHSRGIVIGESYTILQLVAHLRMWATMNEKDRVKMFRYSLQYNLKHKYVKRVYCEYEVLSSRKIKRLLKTNDYVISVFNPYSIDKSYGRVSQKMAIHPTNYHEPFTHFMCHITLDGLCDYGLDLNSVLVNTLMVSRYEDLTRQKLCNGVSMHVKGLTSIMQHVGGYTPMFFYSFRWQNILNRGGTIVGIGEWTGEVDGKITNVSGHLMNMLIACNFFPIDIFFYVSSFEQHLRHLNGEDVGFIFEQHVTVPETRLFHNYDEYLQGVDAYIRFAEYFDLPFKDVHRIKEKLHELSRIFPKFRLEGFSAKEGELLLAAKRRGDD